MLTLLTAGVATFCLLSVVMTVYTTFASERVSPTLIWGALAVASLLAWGFLKKRAEVQTAQPTAPAYALLADAAPAKEIPLHWCEEKPDDNCMLRACMQQGAPTFVLLGAEWCPACAILAIRIKYDDVARTVLSEYHLVKVDVDLNDGVIDRFGAKVLPSAFILGKSCEVIQRLEGKEQLHSFLKRAKS